MSSQKFAGFIFATAVLTASGFFMGVAAYANLVMAVVGLYTAFVGGRAWSDSAALKAGVPAQDVSVVKKLPAAPAPAPAKEKKLDVEVD